MSNKRITISKEETIKAFSLLNFHHMVNFRTKVNGQWTAWQLLTDKITETVVNSDSAIIEFSFNFDWE